MPTAKLLANVYFLAGYVGARAPFLHRLELSARPQRASDAPGWHDDPVVQEAKSLLENLPKTPYMNVKVESIVFIKEPDKSTEGGSDANETCKHGHCSNRAVSGRRLGTIQTA